MNKEDKDSRIELLISTMNQKDGTISEKINIKSNAIIINQANYTDYLLLTHTHVIKMYSFSEKGVGLSRNNALQRASSEICILVDDDMVMYDNYEELITNEFDKNQNKMMDILIFNLEGKNSRFESQKPYRVKKYNYMRFGAAGIAFRRRSIISNRVTFSLEFGGGTKIGSGEDTIFLKDCLDKGMKIKYIPIKIGKLDVTRESSWFKGYNEKFFQDKGKLFYTISGRLSKFIAIRFAFNHRNYMPMSKSIRYLFKGIKERKNETKI